MIHLHHTAAIESEKPSSKDGYQITDRLQVLQ